MTHSHTQRLFAFSLLSLGILPFLSGPECFGLQAPPPRRTRTRTIPSVSRQDASSHCSHVCPSAQKLQLKWMLYMWDRPPTGKFQSADEVTNQTSRVITQRFPYLSSKEPPKSTKYPTGWWEPLSSNLHGQTTCIYSRGPVKIQKTITENHHVVRGWNSESCAGHHKRSQETSPGKEGSETTLSQLILSPQLLLPRDVWVLH